MYWRRAALSVISWRRTVASGVFTEAILYHSFPSNTYVCRCRRADFSLARNGASAEINLVPQLEINQVEARADRDAFIKFPWRIYANDPAWVPPLVLERKEFLSRKHPFYEHGDAALFLARAGGEIVGRVMASHDPSYNSLHGTNLGCFGLFDSIDDQEVADALFEAAAAWLRARGRDEIMGPIDYSTNYV